MDRIIRPDGAVIPASPKNKKDYKLKELQEIVGGYIEIVPAVHSDEVIVVNEEGKLLNLPYNPIATLYFQAYWDTNDYIVGNVLICDKKHIK